MGVDTADAFFEGDVFFLRHEEFCIIASVLQICDDSSCDFSVIGCFEECSVWGAFAGGVEAVAIVDKDFHNAVGRQLWDSLEDARSGRA